MPNIEPNKFQRLAEECWRNAEQASNPIDREAWLRLAEDWMKFGRGEDLTRGSNPAPLRACNFQGCRISAGHTSPSLKKGLTARDLDDRSAVAYGWQCA